MTPIKHSFGGLLRRRIAMLPLLLLAGATLSLTAYAIASAAQPDGKGKPAGPPAAIQLAPNPLKIACNGSDASTLTVRLKDASGRPVADGTSVFFDVRYGFADPVETTTSKGEAVTKVRLYPTAAQFPDDTTTTVFAGDLRASINIRCTSGSPGCNPLSPPQHPLSPPCQPDPSMPSVGCTPATNDKNPEYHMTLRAVEDAGVVTVYAGVEDLGGRSYSRIEWLVCRSPLLNLIGAQPAPGAPPACHSPSVELEQTKLSCANPDGSSISTFGDMWVLRFQCVRNGEVHVYLGQDSAVVRNSNPKSRPTSIDSATADCVLPPTPTPSPIPSPSCDDLSPQDALYDLYVNASENSGAVTAHVGVLSTGGHPYQAAQWGVCYDPSKLAFDSITRAPGAPVECFLKATPNPGLVLVGCLNYGGDFLDIGGDAWIVTFRCLGKSQTRLGLRHDSPLVGFGSLVSWQGNDARPPVGLRGGAATCTQTGTPLTTTPTAAPPNPTPVFTAVPHELCRASSSEPTPTPAPPGAPAPLYRLRLSPLTSADSFSIAAGIDDLGGGAYEFAQWYVCYDSSIVQVTAERASGAPTTCGSIYVDGLSVSLACQLPPKATAFFGNAFLLHLACLRTGTANFRLFSAPGLTAVGKPGIVYQPVAVQNTAVYCTGGGSTPTPVP